MASNLHILFEHACGYALFRVKEFEEIAMFVPAVQKSILDLNKFQSLVQLVAFSPFKSGTNALDNINSISEGILHEDLQLFLETNVPKSSKKQKVILGVSDSKIGSAIQEALGINCQFTDVVPEVIRGVRSHFDNLIKGLTPQLVASSECSLGRSYSRAKVKFNVNRADNMVIQSISLLDQLDKDINTFSMRLREWYSYHFPELVKIVNDNYTYARVAKILKNRKDITDNDEELIEKLEQVIMDRDKAQSVVNAIKTSMGMDISPIDLINIELFTSKIINLAEYRRSLMEYLISRMHNIAPNLATLIGETVGARLISHAGSLMNLAKYPASTVQILGAEKALFRALKTKGNTPKYGLIFHSTFIGRATSKNKGRISRFLANKCSIASRIDCFNDFPTDIFGSKLREQVEDRLKFFESGEVPKKNVDVMKEAIDEANIAIEKANKKKRKKKRKREAALNENDATNENETKNVDNATNGDVRTDSVEVDSVPQLDTDEPAVKKRKKKKKNKATAE